MAPDPLAHDPKAEKPGTINEMGAFLRGGFSSS